MMFSFSMFSSLLRMATIVRVMKQFEEEGEEDVYACVFLADLLNDFFISAKE